MCARGFAEKIELTWFGRKVGSLLFSLLFSPKIYVLYCFRQKLCHHCFSLFRTHFRPQDQLASTFARVFCFSHHARNSERSLVCAYARKLATLEAWFKSVSFSHVLVLLPEKLSDARSVSSVLVDLCELFTQISHFQLHIHTNLTFPHNSTYFTYNHLSARHFHIIHNRNSWFNRQS